MRATSSTARTRTLAAAAAAAAGTQFTDAPGRPRRLRVRAMATRRWGRAPRCRPGDRRDGCWWRHLTAAQARRRVRTRGGGSWRRRRSRGPAPSARAARRRLALAATMANRDSWKPPPAADPPAALVSPASRPDWEEEELDDFRARLPTGGRKALRCEADSRPTSHPTTCCSPARDDLVSARAALPACCPVMTPRSAAANTTPSVLRANPRLGGHLNSVIPPLPGFSSNGARLRMHFLSPRNERVKSRSRLRNQGGGACRWVER